MLLKGIVMQDMQEMVIKSLPANIQVISLAVLIVLMISAQLA